MFVSAVLGHHSLIRGVGVISPLQLSLGVSRGADNNFCSPRWWGIQGQCLRSEILGNNCLVKYCDFVVNMDHSL
jgi:hypothetical protein